MQKEDVRRELSQNPFVPLRLHISDGRTVDVPFPNVVHMLGYGVLVLIGLREGTHQADGYDRFMFEQIDRIETMPARSPAAA
jgi:hypothetical protein